MISAFDHPLGFLRKLTDGDITLEETKTAKQNLNQI